MIKRGVRRLGAYRVRGGGLTQTHVGGISYQILKVEIKFNLGKGEGLTLPYLKIFIFEYATYKKKFF